MPKQKLSKTVVDELLRYCYDSGELFWKPRGRHWFDRDQDHSRWNNRFSDKIAGNVCKRPCGYKSKYVKILGKSYSFHRIVWLIAYGEEAHSDIDHIDRDATNNKLENLRIVTHTENMQNKSLYRNNKSGISGVGRLRGYWRARIRVENTEKHLGMYDTLLDAVAALKSAELKYKIGG